VDRRKFLKSSVCIAAAASIPGSLTAVAAASNTPEGDELPGKDILPVEKEVNIRFLGTGAADWHGPDKRGEHRRNASILVEGKFLIDYTSTVKDMLPQDFIPETIFYTHSHSDHFNPVDALILGVKKVCLGETWLDRARDAFEKASKKTGLPIPEIVPLKIGGRYEQDGLVLMPLPGNHATGDLSEQALIFLIESTDARVLYATDTAGIMSVAARYAQIDNGRQIKPVTGLIMEATMGMDHEDDWRLFSHSSVATVVQTVKVLKFTRAYTPKPRQNVYITHLARGLHPTQAELDKTLPKPIKAAFDGLEITF